MCVEPATHWQGLLFLLLLLLLLLLLYTDANGVEAVDLTYLQRENLRWNILVDMFEDAQGNTSCRYVHFITESKPISKSC